MTIYKESDKQIKKLKKQISAEFHNFATGLKMDELNVITLRKSVDSMYERMDKRNRNAFIFIIRDQVKQLIDDGIIADIEDEIDYDDIVDELVESYNPTTEYRYDTEMDRKESRLVESILSQKTKQGARDSINRNARVWFNQTRQYCDNAVDKARETAFKMAGIEYVIWHTQKDGKVCEECRDRDGHTFQLNHIPDKHWHCRCWWSPKV